MPDIGDRPINTVPDFAGWNPYLVISRQGDHLPCADVFPYDQLPTNDLGFVEEFFNDDRIDITSASPITNLPVAVGEQFDIYYDRKVGHGYGSKNLFEEYYDPTPSPRLGFQISNVFKHQAYWKLLVHGTGTAIPGHNIFWWGSAGYATMEYATNCRLKPLYLTHGKVSGVRYDESAKKIYIKILDQITALGVKATDSMVAPGGQILVWSKSSPANSAGVVAPQKFDIAYVNYNWEVVIDASSATTKYYIEIGDFFGLTGPVGAMPYDLKVVSAPDSVDAGKIGLLTPEGYLDGGGVQISGADATLVPFIVNDPAMMHEYNLKPVHRLLETDEQHRYCKTNIIGVWVPRTLVEGQEIIPSGFNGYVAYVQKENQSDVWLPTDLADAQARGEWTAFGGTFYDGVQLLRKNNASSIRLIVSGINPKRYQNFATGSLTGEFALLGGAFHEILSHPRTDTVEITTNSLTGGVRTALGIITTGAVSRAVSVVSNTLPQKLTDSIGTSTAMREIAASAAASAMAAMEASLLSNLDKLYGDKTGEAIDSATTSAAAAAAAEANRFYRQIFSTGSVPGDPSGVTSAVVSKVLGDILNTPSAIEAVLVQRKFWLINEMYKGSSNAVLGLWGGSATVTPGSEEGFINVTWKGSRVDASQLSTTEIDRWKSETLDTRALANMTDHLPGCVVAYKNYKTQNGNAYTIYPWGWMLHDRSTGTSHYLRGRFVVTLGGTTTADSSTVTCQATVEASADIATGNWVFLTFDTPFDRAGEGLENYSVSMDTKLTQSGSGINERWGVALSGLYFAGRYHFAERMDANLRFSLVNFSFGYNIQPGHPFGAPAVFSTTRRTDNSLSMTENPLSGRQHLFYNDPDSNNLLVMRSADRDWHNQIEQRAITIGAPLSVGTTPPLDAALATNPIFSLPSEKPTPGSYFTTYWLRLRDHFFQSRVYGDSGVNTPLYRKYELNKTGNIAGLHLPFEFYAPAQSSRGSNIKIPAYFAPTIPAKEVGLVAINSNKDPTKVAEGFDPTTTTGMGNPLQSVEYRGLSQLVFSAHSKEVLYNRGGQLLLIYSNNLPMHYNPGTMHRSGRILPTAPAVYLLGSENEGHDWGSPRLPRPDNLATTEGKEWARPLVIARCMDLAAAILDHAGNRLLIFGFVYEPGYYNDFSHMSLAMYAISWPTLQLDKNPNGGATLFKVCPARSETDYPSPSDACAVATYRTPWIANEIWECDLPLPTGHSIPSATVCPFEESKAADEMVVKIIGNAQSTAAWHHEDGKEAGDAKPHYRYNCLNKDLIFPAVQGPNIGVMVRNQRTREIQLYRSGDKGRTWSRPQVAYAREAEAPYAYGDLFFYFRANALYCKRQSMWSLALGGDDTRMQELLDTVTSSVVATNVFPQKISVRKAASGITTAHYILSNGAMGASISSDGGAVWRSLENW